MFFVDSEVLKNTPVAPIVGQSYYLQVKKILIHLINNRIDVQFSAINGQILTNNFGYNLNEVFTVLVFDDGKIKVYSKIKKINENDYQILKDISSLNTANIKIYYPPLNIQYDEDGDVFIFKNSRKFSLKTGHILDVWLENGLTVRKTTTAAYTVNYQSNFNLIYNDNCIISNALGAPGSNAYTYLIIINENDHLEISGNVGDMDNSTGNSNIKLGFFSSNINSEISASANITGQNITFQRQVFDGVPSTKLRRPEGGTSFAYINNFNLIDPASGEQKILLIKCVRDGVICLDYDEV